MRPVRLKKFDEYDSDGERMSAEWTAIAEQFDVDDVLAFTESVKLLAAMVPNEGVIGRGVICLAFLGTMLIHHQEGGRIAFIDRPEEKT